MKFFISYVIKSAYFLCDSSLIYCIIVPFTAHNYME